MISLVEQVQAVREGGAVQRCHTFRHSGHYDVAQHCYGALSLLLLLYPEGEPPLHLIKAVLWHDVPERWTGDVPATALREHPALKKTVAEMEELIVKRLGLPILLHTTMADLSWLRAVDILELWLWACENDQGVVASTCERVINEKKKQHQFPDEAWAFFTVSRERSIESVRRQLDRLMDGSTETIG